MNYQIKIQHGAKNVNNFIYKTKNYLTNYKNINKLYLVQQLHIQDKVIVWICEIKGQVNLHKDRQVVHRRENSLIYHLSMELWKEVLDDFYK